MLRIDLGGVFLQLRNNCIFLLRSLPTRNILWFYYLGVAWRKKYHGTSLSTVSLKYLVSLELDTQFHAVLRCQLFCEISSLWINMHIHIKQKSTCWCHQYDLGFIFQQERCLDGNKTLQLRIRHTGFSTTDQKPCNKLLAATKNHRRPHYSFLLSTQDI